MQCKTEDVPGVRLLVRSIQFCDSHACAFATDTSTSASSFVGSSECKEYQFHTREVVPSHESAEDT